MKKSLWLALILLATSSAFSQSDTNKVVLDSITAHKVIVDLITGDAAKQENETLKAIIEAKDQELDVNYKTILDMQANRTDLELASKQLQLVIDEQDKALDYNEAQLDKQKDKTLFWKIACGAAVVGGILIGVK